jgi:hypothetical protein
MFPAAACLLAGSLLFQNPAPAPSPPSPPPDERKPAVALDPELRRAIDALRTTNGMRFEAVVNAHAPQPRAIAAATRETPQREPDVGDDVRLTAVAQRDRPMHVEHERVDAWRQGERVAWRARDSEEWQLFVLKREAAEQRPAARPHPAALRDGEDARLLRVVAQLATPRELLDEAEGRITNCVKVSPREGEEAGTVFECGLEPDVARRLFASLAAGDSLRVDVLTAAFTLRIGVDHGQIATLALDHRLPLHAVGAGVAAADGPVETLRRYRIRETGNLEVEVPEEVKRLLDGSGDEVAGQKSR